MFSVGVAGYPFGNDMRGVVDGGVDDNAPSVIVGGSGGRLNPLRNRGKRVDDAFAIHVEKGRVRSSRDNVRESA